MSTASFEALPLVADLRRPENVPAESGGPPPAVEFLSTHGSFVFRTPVNVYKVKRAKDYGFLDYRSLAARRHFCDEELRLNRRLAPDVYLEVLPVRRDAAGHSLVRGGEVVDWCVHMRTLPDEQSALSLLRAGRLGHDELSDVAERLARFYREAPPVAAVDGRPASALLARNLEENFAQAAAFAGRLLDTARLAEVEARQRSWLEDNAERLARRTAREGHGDLRLEHVYLTPQGPRIIDCIEFLERFRVADPALDVAFLAMDLRRHGRPDLADYFLARCAHESGDWDAWPLVDGYMSYRAFVRAKVACFVAEDGLTPRAVAARKAGETSEMLELSHRLLGRPAERPTLGGPFPAAQTLIAVGGIIGSGKTTVAEALSRRHGLAVVSADAARKELAGLRHEQRGGAELYTEAWHERVQDEILRRAELVLASGRSAILDTTFSKRALRQRARELATRTGSRFLFVECRVPPEVARERLAARRGGLSDAREDLLDAFLAGWEPVDELPEVEHAVVDATAPPASLPELLPVL
jgi:aminoglycoside phosphotransferase family enzyme/predicted kinase